MYFKKDRIQCKKHKSKEKQLYLRALIQILLVFPLWDVNCRVQDDALLWQRRLGEFFNLPLSHLPIHSN